MTETSEHFKLNSSEEVEKFEKFLSDYSIEKAVQEVAYLNLVNAYAKLQGQENGDKIFTVLLDLKINLVLLNYDNVKSLECWGNKTDTNILKPETILDSKDTFFRKMDLHRHHNAFIFRYRAVWDKIMGLIVLLHSPKDYENFLSAKSRKKSFVKIAKQLPHLFSDESINAIIELLTNFDNDFRTPEAHKTGRLRKFSFTLDEIYKNPAAELTIDYWNKLISVLYEIDRVFFLNK